MEYRSLGRSGLKVSLAGLGCNNFGMRIDADATAKVVGAALDAGINFFDTAISYGGGKSEVFLGEALAGRRDEVVIATKWGGGEKYTGAWGRASRRQTLAAVEQSLRSLATDYLDLYQLHRPDPDTPMEETLDALDTLVTQGKVRYIGCSNFAGWQLADAHWIAEVRGWRQFVSVQNEWSVFERAIEAEVVPAAERFGVGVLPFFPLASGLLTGKYRKGQPAPEGSRLAPGTYFARFLTDARLDAVERLIAWGDERGRSVAEVALSYLASFPVVSSVIAGATTPEQVAANVAATKADLTKDEQAEIAALATLAAGA